MLVVPVAVNVWILLPAAVVIVPPVGAAYVPVVLRFGTSPAT
jgi:hypothetical protein